MAGAYGKIHTTSSASLLPTLLTLQTAHFADSSFTSTSQLITCLSQPETATLFNAMAAITSLAPELMQCILGLVEPPSHLNLALTSKRLHSQLNWTLNYNRACHAQYRSVSDIHPSTIPRLLRTIINGDSIAAWHVRSVEIWGVRKEWGDWNKSHELIEPQQNGRPIPPDLHADTTYSPGFFSDRELDRFQALIIKDIGLGVEAVDWLDNIKMGRDSELKALLIAMCPRLSAVRFVRGLVLNSFLP